MSDYKRATERFRCYGIDLNNPVDNVRPGYYPIIENVRSYTDGIVQPRQGLSVIATVSSVNKTPVWSVRRLNDPNSGGYRHIVHVQDTLFHGTTSTGYTKAQYNGADISLANTPSVMVPFRPDQATSSWMYITDTVGMVKIVGANAQNIAVGTVHNIGVTPPANPPTTELAAPSGDAPFPFSSVGSTPNQWVVDNIVINGTPSPALVARTTSTTTVAARHDSGGTGWVSVLVNDATASTLGIGQILAADIGLSAIPLPVMEIYPKSGTTSLTVKSVLSDAGNGSGSATGLVIIQPSQSVPEIKRNCIVQINGGTNYFRVTDVIPGPDESKCFRINSGGLAITNGWTLAVVSSFRTYDPVGITEAGGDVLHDYGLFGGGNASIQTTTTVGGSTKTGWIQISPTASGVFTDLTQNVSLQEFGTQTAMTDDDYVHVGIKVSDISKISQGRIMLDCDNTSYSITGATNATPIVITTAAIHDINAGDTVFISGVTGNTAANGTWTASAPTGTTFTILNGATNTAGSGAYVNGGTAKPQFKKNFYYRAFSPNDLTAAVKGTQTALDNRTTIIQHNQADFSGHGSMTPGPHQDTQGTGDNPGNEDQQGGSGIDPNAPPVDNPSRSQAVTGDSQWSDLLFRIGDFKTNRVGSDSSRGMATINAIRFEFTLTDTVLTQTLALNCFSIFGGYPLDVANLASPYIYRYRYRVSTTGAVSNWSPATRSGVFPRRGQSVVTCAASAAPEVDKIDIQRLGGVNTTWLTVGSIANGTTPFTDKTSDIAAMGAAAVSDLDTSYQPWPVTAPPAKGTTAVNGVVGVYVKDDGGSFFDARLVKGTPIKVDGIDTQIRRLLPSGIIEVDDSLGARSAKTWEIPQPLLRGVTLPALWEWNQRGFACGDLNNPGYLYWTNGGSLDSTQDTNYLEVTPPSEPLIMGCSFNGKNYVWSSERMFEIWQSAIGDFQAIEIPGHKGLSSRYALCTGEKIWYLSRDGIYQTGGGDSISITDETLRPLFTQEGGAGTAVNGFNAPDFSQTTKLRLSYYKGYLYFNYQDTGGALRTLVYTVRAEKPGWWPDTYLDGRGVTSFYGEEGDGVNSLLACGNDVTTAKLYQSSGTADNAGPISCHLRTQYFDAQDRRGEKRWGDLIIDADPNNATITPVVYTNGSTSGTLTLSPATFTAAARTQQIVEVSTGSDPAGDHSRNAALDLTWSSTGATPKLYFWEPSYIIRPEQTDMRATDWDDLGVPQDKFIQGLEIDANTFNVAKTLTVEYDGLPTNIGETLSATHNGRKITAYSFHPPFIAHTVRLHSTDAVNWAFYGAKWYFQPEAPKADHWESQQCSFGGGDFVHIRAMYATLMSTQNVTLTVTRTEDGHADTYTIPTTSGLRMRQYVPFVATKGKLYTFVFSSTSTGGQFRLYKPETSVLVKEWASETQYADRNPFGGQSGQGGTPV